MEVIEQLAEIAKMHGGTDAVAQIIKAAETVATNTFSPDSRSVWSPENLEAEVRLTVPKATPLRNRFPRVGGLGQATAWKRLTSKLHVRSGGVAGNGTNTQIAFADAGAPGETAQTFVVESAAYKLLGRKIELGGLAIAASRGEGREDAFTQRRRQKMVELMLGEEELIIGGNKSANALEFDGLSAQITTNSGVRSLITVSGIGRDVTTIFKEGGESTLLVCNARNLQALADELQGGGSIQRILMDQTGSIGGNHLKSIINPLTGTLIDVVASRYVADQAFLLDERDESGQAHIEMEDLIPVSQVDVPSSNFSSIAFVLEATVLKVMAEPYQFKYTGTLLS
jgi:hypothetical protein